jgi:hypothetical protein
MNRFRFAKFGINLNMPRSVRASSRHERSDLHNDVESEQ